MCPVSHSGPTLSGPLPWSWEPRRSSATIRPPSSRRFAPFCPAPTRRPRPSRSGTATPPTGPRRQSRAGSTESAARTRRERHLVRKRRSPRCDAVARVAGCAGEPQLGLSGASPVRPRSRVARGARLEKRQGRLSGVRRPGPRSERRQLAAADRANSACERQAVADHSLGIAGGMWACSGRRPSASRAESGRPVARCSCSSDAMRTRWNRLRTQGPNCVSAIGWWQNLRW